MSSGDAGQLPVGHTISRVATDQGKCTVLLSYGVWWVGVSDAFSTYSIFDLQQVYRDATPSYSLGAAVGGSLVPLSGSEVRKSVRTQLNSITPFINRIQVAWKTNSPNNTTHVLLEFTWHTQDRPHPGPPNNRITHLLSAHERMKLEISNKKTHGKNLQTHAD